MICPVCGTQNEPGRKFCGECGTRLGITCPDCGTINPPTAKFCGECGASLAGVVAAPATPGTSGRSAVGTIPAAPATTAAPENRAVTPSAPGAGETVAERRIVSVLFADLVGFTSRSEQRDPEDVREFLGEYFDLASRLIARYGGTVEKFIGDAVMAVWGTPTAHEDDPERAVRAALELADAAPRLAGSQDDGSAIQLRAAVMTGEAAVTVGATGQGMVAGDLVNTASRLQSVAPPGGVLVGEATYRAAQSAIAFEPVGEQHLRGKALPVEAWRPLRIVAGRRGAGRSDRLETPFVGRDHEFRLLKELFHSCAHERRARFVLLTGIAGMGGSRLAWELEKYLDGLVVPVYWHQGRSPAYGEGVTYWAIAEMIRQRARIAESDDAEVSRQKLAATVREYVTDDSERRWVEPRLGALLALDETPPGERDELFAAWRRFFELVSEKGTTVLVFEDLQWADFGLLDFVESVLEWSRAHPILVIGLARPELRERRPNWGARLRNFSTIELEPLSAAAMAELVNGLIPGIDPRVVAQIQERAEGVPLYAVETVRMLVDEGRLVPTEGGYQLVRPIEQLDVPPTLRALIASRLDALDARDRALIQDAAVLGQTFSAEVLAAVSGRPTEQVDARLRELARKELIALDADASSPERGQYRFVQGLIREVAYSLLSRRDRRSRHLATARYYESVAGDEMAGVLASHYLDAYRAASSSPEADALAAQTRVALRGAIDRAVALHAHDQALAYLEQAVTVTPDRAERAELAERGATLALAAARYQAAETYVRVAIEWHESQADRPSAARAAAILGSVLLISGRPDEAIAQLESALSELSDLQTDPEVMRLTAELARAYMVREQVDRALEVSDRALAAAAPNDHVPVIADALVTRGAALMMAGRPREGVAVSTGALSLAEAHGLLRPQFRARLNVLGPLLNDDAAVVLANARAGLELARRLGQRDWIAGFHWFVQGALYSLGDWDAALAGLGSLEEEGIEELPPHAWAEQQGFMAEIEAQRGDLTSAEARMREIEPVVAALPSTSDAATYRLHRSAIALAAGRLEEAHDAALSTVDVSLYLAGLAYPLAGIAAAMMRDRRRLRSALYRFYDVPTFGRVPAARRATLEGAIEALEGRLDEARSAFHEAARRWRQVAMPFDLALSQLLFLQLAEPSDREARAAAEEAREILVRLAAAPFLARLDSIVAQDRGAETERETQTVSPAG